MPTTRPGASSGTDRVTDEDVDAQRPLVESLHALLAATAGRPTSAASACTSGRWSTARPRSETRHAAWPLRLGPAGTDAVVESHRIACSHFDAFRFFTDAARPLNTLSPAAHDRPAFEQPACLHAGMDLYKHAFRLTPLVPSELVADCFELAREIRMLDMRAAPYDLADLGVTPVRIETPEGKQEYAAAQLGFAGASGTAARAAGDGVRAPARGRATCGLAWRDEARARPAPDRRPRRAPARTPGDRVRPGTLIARASDSGAPDGCHLHFERRDVGGGLDTAHRPRKLLHLTRAG